MTKTRGDRANLDEVRGALPNVSRRYIRKLVPNNVSVDTRPQNMFAITAATCFGISY